MLHLQFSRRFTTGMWEPYPSHPLPVTRPRAGENLAALLHPPQAHLPNLQELPTPELATLLASPSNFSVSVVNYIFIITYTIMVEKQHVREREVLSCTSLWMAFPMLLNTVFCGGINIPDIHHVYGFLLTHNFAVLDILEMLDCHFKDISFFEFRLLVKKKKKSKPQSGSGIFWKNAGLEK